MRRCCFIDLKFMNNALWWATINLCPFFFSYFFSLFDSLKFFQYFYRILCICREYARKLYIYKCVRILEYSNISWTMANDMKTIKLFQTVSVKAQSSILRINSNNLLNIEQTFQLFDCFKLFECFQQFIVITIDFGFFLFSFSTSTENSQHENWPRSISGVISLWIAWNVTTEKSLESYWTRCRELTIKLNEAINIRFIHKYDEEKKKNRATRADKAFEKL